VIGDAIGTIPNQNRGEKPALKPPRQGLATRPLAKKFHPCFAPPEGHADAQGTGGLPLRAFLEVL
tara:strand:- start:282 stop:476 length:195 start_codon:yes stop_codon:yes gene_type:complete